MSNNPHNLQVGQKVFQIPMSRGEAEYVEITKIGRKYATISNKYSGEDQFELDSLRGKDTGYGWGYDYKYYLSRELYEEEAEREKLWRLIKDKVQYSTPPCNLEDMRKIAGILKIETQQPTQVNK